MLEVMEVAMRELIPRPEEEWEGDGGMEGVGVEVAVVVVVVVAMVVVDVDAAGCTWVAGGSGRLAGGRLAVRGCCDQA